MSPSRRPSLVEQVREGMLGDLTSGKLDLRQPTPDENAGNLVLFPLGPMGVRA